jgi:hypothetical protein
MILAIAQIVRLVRDLLLQMGEEAMPESLTEQVNRTQRTQLVVRIWLAVSAVPLFFFSVIIAHTVLSALDWPEVVKKAKRGAWLSAA